MAACLWFHLHMLVLLSALRGGVKQTPRLVKIDQAYVPHLFLSLPVSVCVCTGGHQCHMVTVHQAWSAMRKERGELTASNKSSMTTECFVCQ